jgi:hypothetical protein
VVSRLPRLLVVPGDRLADTLFSAPLVLQRHVDQLRGDGVPVPEPTTPDIWAIHDRYPDALIGFAEVVTDQTGEEIVEDEALDDEISRDAQKSGYREEDAVEVVRNYRREKSPSPAEEGKDSKSGLISSGRGSRRTERRNSKSARPLGVGVTLEPDTGVKIRQGVWAPALSNEPSRTASSPLS